MRFQLKLAMHRRGATGPSPEDCHSVPGLDSSLHGCLAFVAASQFVCLPTRNYLLDRFWPQTLSSKDDLGDVVSSIGPKLAGEKGSNKRS